MTFKWSCQCGGNGTVTLEDGFTMVELVKALGASHTAACPDCGRSPTQLYLDGTRTPPPAPVIPKAPQAAQGDYQDAT